MAKIKMLRTGETDINTTDIWRYSFNSDYPTFKIGLSGSADFTITTGSDTGYYDVVHNLGYFPMFFANIQKNGNAYQVPTTMSSGIALPKQGGGTDVVAFISELINVNTLRIEAYFPVGFAANDETFTAYWTIMLDDF